MSEALLVSQADLLLSLERLRSGEGGAQRLDPVRLHYLQALAQRMVAAEGQVQALLQARLQQALEASGEWRLGGDEVPLARRAQAIPSSSAKPPVRPEPVEGHPGTTARQPERTRQDPPALSPTPLGQLNQHLVAASQAADDDGAHPAWRTDELRSARRFRETWALISAETQVDQAVHRGPENAGPLNSHSLMLRTLGLMRELSPDYLRCFLAHADTLLWLEQAYGQLRQPAGKAKAARTGKPKK
jgi:hypothetical protein